LPDREKAEFLDGYAVIKAARRAAGKEKEGSRPKKAERKPEPADSQRPAEGKSPGLHIRHTVRPPTHEIICYECGYSFRLTGKAQRTFCPRCRVILDMTDYSIETVWHQPIKTCGRIRLAPHAVVENAELVAGEIILEGTVKEGRLRALRVLEIHPRARFDLSQVHTRDLRIASGAVVRSRQPVTAENIEVSGKLEGRIQATGRIIIHVGGLVKGELSGPHLVVEEGGGLRARCAIVPDTAGAAAAEPGTGPAIARPAAAGNTRRCSSG